MHCYVLIMHCMLCILDYKFELTVPYCYLMCSVFLSHLFPYFNLCKCRKLAKKGFELCNASHLTIKLNLSVFL